jgi:hypothetical protein
MPTPATKSATPLGELVPAWLHRAVFTHSPLAILTVEVDQRRRARLAAAEFVDLGAGLELRSRGEHRVAVRAQHRPGGRASLAGCPGPVC